MTEIVRTISTAETTDITLGKSRTKAKTVEHVTVRSIRTDRIDVSVVRAFVAALDQVQAPGRAKIEGHRSDVGHVIQLTAKWENEIAQPEDPAKVDEPGPVWCGNPDHDDPCPDCDPEHASDETSSRYVGDEAERAGYAALGEQMERGERP